MYTTSSICPPHSFPAAILCRLFGKPDSTKFFLGLLPLIDAAVNATVMNWAQILSDNLARTIIEYRRKRRVSSRVYPPFFMSAYVTDAICFGSKFPIMGWKHGDRIFPITVIVLECCTADFMFPKNQITLFIILHTICTGSLLPSHFQGFLIKWNGICYLIQLLIR